MRITKRATAWGVALCVAAAVAVGAQPTKGPGVDERVTPAAPFVPSGGAYCSTPAASIPDNSPGGVLDSQVITDTGTITDLDVSIDVTHTWVGDLSFTLSHTGGASATILARPGNPATPFGCPDNDIAGGIDDEGAIALETHCAGTQPWIDFYGVGGDPAGPVMANWDGEDFSGTWTLTVTDNAGGDTGVLNEWCLLPSGTIVPVELQTFSIEN